MMQNILDLIPKSRQETVKKFVLSMSEVRGVKAIVLGGSYARGTAKAESDIDLGLYYSDSAPLDISDIKKVASEIALSNKPAVITNLYEWGAWVNGGAWIETGSGKIDLLYRSLEHVEKVIQESKQGKFTSDFLQQPPFGFYSVTYLGETKTCIPLFDPQQYLQALKEQISPYPSALKKSIIQENLWGTAFTLLYAKKCAKENDIYTTVGCITRMLACLTQALFALNEEYFISDKEAMSTIENFAQRPKAYNQGVKSILKNLSSPTDLINSVQKLEKLFLNVKELAGPLYVPKYQID